MKKINSKKEIRNLLRIILITFTGLLIIGGITVYFMIHNYISKLNLVEHNGKESAVLETETDTTEFEPVQETQAQIKQNKIALLGNTLFADLEETAKSQEVINSWNSNIQSESVAEDASKDEADLDAKINDNVNNTATIPESDDITNILLIGSDTKNVSDAKSSDKNVRSDSFVMLSVNEKTKSITATSFLRDIYLQIPGIGNDRLSVAYSKGGADLLIQTLKQNFKIETDHYIIADFYSIMKLVDEIGGIKVNIDKNEPTSLNQIIKEINIQKGEAETSDFIKKSGSIIINGKQTLAYLRNVNAASGDTYRTSRQREVLRAIYIKVKKQNMAQMNHFLNAILPMLTTDFSENEILAYLFQIPDYLNYGFVAWILPTEGTYTNQTVRGMDVVDIDFDKNIQEISKHLNQEQ